MAVFECHRIPVLCHDLIGREISDDEIELMANKCSNNGANTQGMLKVLKKEDMINIYKMAR